jgi:hypothetical protein
VADSISLADLPVLSTFRLTARLANDTGTTMTIDLLQPTGDVHGSIDITKSTGNIVGGLTVDLDDTLVEPVAIALSIGDVIQSQSSGETLVVRAIGLGPDGTLWSSSTTGSPTFQSVGWTRVGTATIS